MSWRTITYTEWACDGCGVEDQGDDLPTGWAIDGDRHYCAGCAA